MKYWLVKSEPDVFSWDMLVAKGAAGEPWTGVRNHQAKLYLMQMKKGDRAFFYHSNIGKEVVGVCEVAKEHYPDPTADPGSPWVCVDMKAVAPFKKFISRDQMKTIPELQDMILVKHTRFSVQPVEPAAWKFICKLGGVKP